MKVRCTVLCLVIAAIVLNARHSEAQSFYGPQQPGYGGPMAPGGMAPGGMAPAAAWPHAAGMAGQYPGQSPYGDLPPVMLASNMGGGSPEVLGDAAECYDCDAGCYGGCGSDRIWVDGEMLFWWRKGRALPPLATTSPAGTPQPQAGVLGQPGTRILFGNETVGDGVQMGGRVDVGLWLDSCETWGIGASGFTLADDNTVFSDSSNGDPTLAIPFFNTLFPAAQESQLVAYANPVGQRLVRGNIAQTAGNEIFGGDLYLRKRLNGAMINDYITFMMQGPGWILSVFEPISRFPVFDIFGHAAASINGPGQCISRWDVVGGYQFSKIKDSLESSFSLVSLNRSFLDPVGTTIDVTDLYDATNTFHGGMIGVMATAAHGRWKMEFLSKIGVGNMHQNVTVSGQTVVTLPPPFGFLSDTRNRGLFAQPSQTGAFSQDKFTVVPEMRIKLSRCLTSNLDVYLAYSCIYWNNVALGSDQLNPAINPFELNNTPNSFQVQSKSFFVQGLSFGGRFHF